MQSVSRLLWSFPQRRTTLMGRVRQTAMERREDQERQNHGGCLKKISEFGRKQRVHFCLPIMERGATSRYGDGGT
jgi:hypothetical protein